MQTLHPMRFEARCGRRTARSRRRGRAAVAAPTSAAAAAIRRPSLRCVLCERVLDVGSGGGFDAFLAARQLGPTGHVIGVDTAPEMIDRARTNLGRTDVTHVDFRLGSIGHLPVKDAR